MIDVKKLSTISLSAGLLFSIVSSAYAMDEDQDLWARICAKERAEADQKRAPKTIMDLGLNTDDLTVDEVWALIQSQQGSNSTEDASPFTETDLEMIRAAGINLESAWTTNPGRPVPEDHAGYRLRAENMPDSQTTGDGQGQAKGLGSFMQELERNPHRDEIWAASLAKKDKKRAQASEKK